MVSVGGDLGFAGLCLWPVVPAQPGCRTFFLLKFLTWLGLQSVVILTPQVRFLRHQIPIVPAPAIGGGAGTGCFRGELQRWNRGIGTVFATACPAGIAVWIIAFMSIYSGDHPWIAASKWIMRCSDGQRGLVRRGRTMMFSGSSATCSMG